MNFYSRPASFNGADKSRNKTSSSLSFVTPIKHRHSLGSLRLLAPSADERACVAEFFANQRTLALIVGRLNQWRAPILVGWERRGGKVSVAGSNRRSADNCRAENDFGEGEDLAVLGQAFKCEERRSSRTVLRSNPLWDPFFGLVFTDLIWTTSVFKVEPGVVWRRNKLCDCYDSGLPIHPKCWVDKCDQDLLVTCACVSVLWQCRILAQWWDLCHSQDTHFKVGQLWNWASN